MGTGARRRARPVGRARSLRPHVTACQRPPGAARGRRAPDRPGPGAGTVGSGAGTVSLGAGTVGRCRGAGAVRSTPGEWRRPPSGRAAR
ncbi:hypothetical protein ADK75_27695 [Streptomyces virginiae]|uniref:Uncharacterized protein n=1 Tax=Streptomyces virginiae TaxID=1961 RepID=A0A0L8M744_STRVG|nr:hypothetical protein ADK75_27695 [Streptomyces virginiae]